MPYVKKTVRQRNLNLQNAGFSPFLDTAGTLNYEITLLLIKYIETHGLSYSSINDIKGSLLGAYDEFNDRVVRLYEDKKINENGDVYGQIIDKI